MNLAANMLGLDNAATPLGLKVMKELQIAESRRLRGLGERQQVALLERLG